MASKIRCEICLAKGEIRLFCPHKGLNSIQSEAQVVSEQSEVRTRAKRSIEFNPLGGQNNRISPLAKQISHLIFEAMDSGLNPGPVFFDVIISTYSILHYNRRV